MTPKPLWVILCHLPEKGRKEKEEIVGDKREGQERKNRSKSEETEEIKTFSISPYLLQGKQVLPILRINMYFSSHMK